MPLEPWIPTASPRKMDFGQCRHNMYLLERFLNRITKSDSKFLKATAVIEKYGGKTIVEVYINDIDKRDVSKLVLH